MCWPIRKPPLIHASPSPEGPMIKQLSRRHMLGGLADADTPQVDTSMSFAIATAWRPWMQMRGINGHTVTDGVGGKVFDINDMPEDFVALSAEHNPDVLEDPVALLGD
ncbi:MAG: DUF1838 domain-containing protein [Gammaproteobacteria bacterium]|nr:MAG: DUF1838 domain-containing protein [Gammaproteobacteria bacterium]